MESTEASTKETAHKVLYAKARCNFEKSAAAARQQAVTDLQRHLVQCINKAECSGDVVFICKDGERVHAAKMMCIGRSEMLTAMFKNGMSETNSLTVTLPEVCSGALLAILEYLYTGDISNYWPIDWKMGIEVIAAARFFMLPSCVDRIMEAFLLEHASEAGKDLWQAAIMFNLAVEYKASDLELVSELAHPLRYTWMHGDYGSQLSEDALDLLLKHTKDKDVTDKNRIYEFFRFRGVLMWALSHSGLLRTDDVQSLFDRIIPGTKGRLCRISCTETHEMEYEWLPGYEVDSANNGLLNMLQAHPTWKEVAVRLLANIDWVQIPPQLFTRIVEPLKLVSDNQLINLFRCYYINSRLSVHLSWIHGSQLVQSRQGSCIQSRDGDVSCLGSAVCELHSNPDERIHIWTFKVKKLHFALGLGFIFWQARAEIERWNFETDSLATMSKSSRALRFIRYDNGGVTFKQAEKPGTWKSGTWELPSLSPTVEFRYDRDARQCSVRVDSLDLGPVFKDLPSLSFFPALYMQGPATVTIAVHRGFDTFCV